MHCFLRFFAINVLHLSMAQENGGCQKFHLLLQKSLFLQPLSRSIVEYIVMRPWTSINVCSHFTGSDKEVPHRLSIPDKKTVRTRLRLPATPYEQLFLPFPGVLHTDTPFNPS